MFSGTNIVDVRMDITIAIYLYSNFRGYFGSPGWWLCFIIVPSIYLLSEMICICMLMTLAPGGGGGGGGVYLFLGLCLQGLYSATNCVVYNNE